MLHPGVNMYVVPVHSMLPVINCTHGVEHTRGVAPFLKNEMLRE